MSQVDPEVNGAMAPMAELTGVPGALDFPLEADEQAGKLQFLTASPSTGLAQLADDNTPGQIAIGYVHPDELTSSSSTNGAAVARVSQRWVIHQAPSTITNDGFSAADVGTPFYIADGNTPGKLSHTATKNRTLGGLVIGLLKYGSDAVRLMPGVIGQAIARGVLLASSKLLGWYPHPVDGSAGATTAEKTIAREPYHGVITGVRFVTLDTLAADATDYVTINVYKADGAGGTHVLVASYDSRATPTGQGAIAAGVPKSFSLSAVAGALNLLETDILSYQVLKAGSGKIVPVGMLEVIGKVN